MVNGWMYGCRWDHGLDRPCELSYETATVKMKAYDPFILKKQQQQKEINGSMGIIYWKERRSYLNLFLCLLSASLIKEYYSL